MTRRRLTPSQKADDQFMARLTNLQALNRSGADIAQALRLPLAEAERLGLVSPQPWSHLAWRLEANRIRWRRRYWR